ncbi:hypothetical protein Scel_44760 [Streptomyces cellostaticus]|nr:hypothetical protein Scel_44760 [Streptomyces cellostaticus]
MDAVVDLPADPQATKPVQVGERALHAPALGAESGTMLGVAPGYQRLHAEVSGSSAAMSRDRGHHAPSRTPSRDSVVSSRRRAHPGRTVR